MTSFSGTFSSSSSSPGLLSKSYYNLYALVCSCSKIASEGNGWQKKNSAKNRRFSLARFFAACALFSLIYTDLEPGTGYLFSDQ